MKRAPPVDYRPLSRTRAHQGCCYDHLLKVRGITVMKKSENQSFSPVLVARAQPTTKVSERCASANLVGTTKRGKGE